MADTTHGADLYLACGCLQLQPAALRAFERGYLAQMPRLIGRLRPTDELVDDVCQTLREKLFVGATPKMAEYSGRGSLLAWLRVVAVRQAIDLSRARRDDDEAQSVGGVVATAAGPELQLLRKRYRPLLQEALNGAMRTLSSAQRLLLKLHFVDGLNLEELAKLFKVNRSTIYRRVGVCLAQMQEAMRSQLQEYFGLSSSEVESLADMLRSDVELSIGDCLKSSLA